MGELETRSILFEFSSEEKKCHLIHDMAKEINAWSFDLFDHTTDDSIELFREDKQYEFSGKPESQTKNEFLGEPMMKKWWETTEQKASALKRRSLFALPMEGCQQVFVSKQEYNCLILCIDFSFDLIKHDF